MATPRVNVIQGEIPVNQILQRVDDFNCKAFEIDCKAKYMELSAGSSIDEITVLLYAGDATLKADKNAGRATMVEFPYGDEWSFLVDKGRYTVYVVVYRPQPATFVYDSDDEQEQEAMR